MSKLAEYVIGKLGWQFLLMIFKLNFYKHFFQKLEKYESTYPESEQQTPPINKPLTIE